MSSLEPRLSALMRASLAGDAQAYRAFLSELTVLLRRYCLRQLGADRLADAEDLVQETLMAIHTRRATYDPDRPVTAWAHAIARYKLVDHLRRRHPQVGVPLDDVEDFLAAPDDTEPAMARCDVGRLLDTLPEQPRALIRQVKLEGASIAETAARTGLSESAVKVGIHRGLKALAARFGAGGNRARNG
ncbi:sigma-70 family RNA polymerase sigma factor [Azospirillum sp. TSO22-1]|uniref:sigma-70 family RNA polymerase sigma factor n=1 Tax=Azospirillum sp. TSO22-1 TaxID=716789 RepID=UPI000D65B371|nr:sigma-70 family RNA polymerase sigma factor [Azospirillum sp. TSO22-1]